METTKHLTDHVCSLDFFFLNWLSVWKI